MQQSDERKRQQYQRPQIPEHVYCNNQGACKPEPGYVWANPDDKNDLRVVPIVIRPPPPRGLFTFNEWVDYDNNRIVGGDELVGLNKKVFNIDKEKLSVAINIPSQKGETTFRSYNSKGELIGETVFFIKGM